MKIMSNVKILLLVAILLISMCVFNLNTVQATEETTITPQAENETLGFPSLSAVTEKIFNSTVPNAIEITKTKTEFANNIIDYSETADMDVLQQKVEEIETEVKTKILQLFWEVAETEEQEDLIKVQMLDLYVDFNTVTVSLNATEYGKEYSKDITIKYAKESNFNTSDETYVKNAVKNIKFAKYVDSNMGMEEQDAVFTIYNIGDEKNASKWSPNTYDFNKLLNDSSITVKTSMFAGGMGGATPWGVPMLVHFYKNGVLYETKSIWNLGAYGITLDNGTPINMATVETTDEVYKTMAKELNNKGLTNIIACYELTAYGTTTNNMSISFNIGAEYNGKQVTVLHKKKDNTYETLTATVKDGMVTVTVSELSPFMIALGSKTEQTQVQEKPNKNLDNEPKTRCCRLYNICKCYCSYIFKWTCCIEI